jgi:hypothetical protein
MCDPADRSRPDAGRYCPARAESAKLQAVDVLLLDTAGRLHVDQQLMDEMKAVSAISAPRETLLVVDSLTGQDAVNVAQSFGGEVDLTGVILTRMDGDARGGAALSMRRSPASRSSSPAPAKSLTRSSRSTPAASRAASSAWATSSRSSRRQPRRSRKKTPSGWRGAWPRASST